VFQSNVLSVSYVYIRMLQVLRLNVLKVDRVLHFPPHLLLPYLGVSSSPSAALHPSQTAEGARQGSAQGARRGMVARTRA
jgi:hypothetical protein